MISVAVGGGDAVDEGVGAVVEVDVIMIGCVAVGASGVGCNVLQASKRIAKPRIHPVSFFISPPFIYSR
jgi:hypothetical protein